MFDSATVTHQIQCDMPLWGTVQMKRGGRVLLHFGGIMGAKLARETDIWPKLFVALFITSWSNSGTGPRITNYFTVLPFHSLSLSLSLSLRDNPLVGLGLHPHSRGLFFLDHTHWHTTVGRTPLDEWSARRRDLYLKTHNTHNCQTSMSPVGFEPTVSAGERP